jgi:hypothetical protein
MTEKEEKHEGYRRYPSLTWPIILITVGLLFLLSNLGVLKIDFWNLWRLWPVLLILAGLEIILGRRSMLGNVIVLIATLAIIGGVVLLLIVSPEVLGTSSSGGVERIDEPLAGVERADLRVDFAAGQLDIGRLTDSSSLIVGDLELATRQKPTWEISRSGSQASMDLGYRRQSDWVQNWQKGDEWDLSLSPKVGLSLDVNMGAGDTRLDLSGLDIRELSVEAGAGRSTITLPDEGDFATKVSGGVGQVIIEIPEGMAARVQVDQGIGNVSVDSRFTREGDSYVTRDWKSAEDRVDLEIEVGVGQVTVR